jgi:hypothetical protein
VAIRSPSDIRLRDPLSQVTRNERKLLLAVSAIGLIVRHAGLVPTKIAALGIEFSQIDQKILLKSVGAIVLCFLCAFVLYALSDFVAWRLEFHGAHREALLDQLRKQKEYDDLGGNFPALPTGGTFRGIKPYEKSDVPIASRAMRRLESPISLLRAIFEFVLPTIVGLIAVIQLFRA